MRKQNTQRMAWSWALMMTASCVAVAAQEGRSGAGPSGLTRQQVVAERLALQTSHRWDDADAQWVLRTAGAVPPGQTREQVRAELVAFAILNRRDEALGGWVLRHAPRRTEDDLTRAQVAAITVRFLAIHDLDEPTQQWVERSRATRAR